MFKTFVSVSTIGSLGLLTALATGYGCSSSTGNGASNDAGSGNEADTGAHTGPSGSSSGSASGSSSGSASGSSSGGGGDMDGGGTQTGDGAVAAPACYAAPAYTALTAAPGPVKGAQGLCTADEISTFITACGDGQTQTSCNDWQNTNILADAGPTTCGACIFPSDSSGNPTNVGPTYTVVVSSTVATFGINYGACISLLDPTNGPACAVALDNSTDCEQESCATCTTTATADSCFTYTDNGACATPVNSVQTACASDQTQGGTCQPGGGKTANPDWTYILNQICGSGAPDGGAGDGG